jgi:tetratricopeptide (TPR) repeat protein
MYHTSLDCICRYERSLTLLEEYYGVDGRENKDVAETLNQLGNVLSSMGAYSAALARCEEALAILQRVTGPDLDDATVAAVLHRIATVHDGLGDNNKALQFYERALSMKQRLYGVGQDHKEIASTLYRLGNALETQREFHSALERYLEALHMKQRLCVPRPLGLASLGVLLLLTRSRPPSRGSQIRRRRTPTRPCLLPILDRLCADGARSTRRCTCTSQWGARHAEADLRCLGQTHIDRCQLLWDW